MRNTHDASVVVHRGVEARAIMTTTTTPIPDQKKVGMVSLGCPKALVDSERILTRLRA